jgi:hypothetical protein
MARRRGRMATFAQIQRDAARAEAARRRAQASSRRAAEQARARYESAAGADERERKRLYAESRTAEVAAGRQIPHPKLHGASGGQGLIDVLKRHLLGQLAEMTGREPTRRHHHDTSND